MGQDRLVRPTMPESVGVAFICAMPMELRPLARRLRLRPARIDGTPIHSGAVDGGPVAAIATGMGTELATRRTEQLLEAVEVSRVIVFGIAGGIDDDARLGTVISPERVIDGASGAEYVPAQLGGAAPAGTIWTTDDLITDPDVVAELRSRGVVALDMETAAIAAACQRHRVRWSVRRVISDRPADGIVTDEVFRLSKQDGRPDAAAVARYFIRHPGHVPRMARLASAARHATVIAAQAAISAGAQAG
jgi:adenosylhomocysteine nucleosidase